MWTYQLQNAAATQTFCFRANRLASGETLRFSLEAARISTLVTGLILFQVVLLTLIGSNNSAREIAAERALYEKERLLGLRPWAYALSKIIFTSLLALFQGVWMCAFVKIICDFPGDFFVQSAVLSGVCVSMTLVCLAFSALFFSNITLSSAKAGDFIFGLDGRYTTAPSAREHSLKAHIDWEVDSQLTLSLIATYYISTPLEANVWAINGASYEAGKALDRSYVISQVGYSF